MEVIKDSKDSKDTMLQLISHMGNNMILPVTPVLSVLYLGVRLI
jgi:hypothetical protein